MKRTLLLILLTCQIAAAQNYQCLQSGVKHYFTNQYGYLRGIRIDSVRISGTDVIYYPFHTPRGAYGGPWGVDSLDSTGGSWLGKKVIAESDGTFLFDNFWHDTVVIKTQAHVGDTWIFFRDTGTTIYYKATVISVDTLSILGILDSVKKINITAWDSTVNITTNPLNNIDLILSKNLGFVQVIDLYMFPYNTPGSGFSMNVDFYTDAVFMDIAYPYSLYHGFSGFGFRLSDFKPPSYNELYQWNTGDLYEYRICNGNLATNIFIAPAEEYDLFSITGVNPSVDSIQYLVDAERYFFNGHWIAPLTPNIISYAKHKNSGVLTYNSQLLIDTVLMPEELGQEALYYYMSYDTSFCMTGAKYSRVVSGMHRAIWISPFENSYPVSIYKTPLGLLSYEHFRLNDGNGNSFEWSKKLIYYDRAGSPCGSMTIPPTSVNDIKQTENTITLFPNPATNTLTITSNNITSISITNLLGQTVYSHEYDAGKVSIDISHLPAGTYLVRVNGNVVKRFVKE